MLPKPDLTSARLKVERAYQHVLNVEEWLRIYQSLNRYDVAIGKDFKTGEDGGSAVTIVSPEKKYPPGHLPSMVGDAVHNLRAALDHVSAAIFRVAGEDAEKASFPIDKNRQSLVSKRNYREIERLAPDLAPVIADYICSGNSADMLVAMNHLDRADKHRTLIITVAVAKIGIACIADENQAKGFAAGTVYILPGGKSPALGSLAHAHNERNNHAPADIVFGEGEIFAMQPIIPTLHQFTQLVIGLIDAVETA
jgi:hypothetical protein